MKFLPQYHSKAKLLAVFSLTIIFFKCIPHLPNFTPQIVFFFYLSRLLPRSMAIMLVIAIAGIADIAVSMVNHFPAFGGWTLFNYSAFIGMVCLGQCKFFSRKNSYFILGSVTASLMFWCWTNFGTWLVSGMYEYSLAGLFKCYVLAIPFIAYSLLAAITWGIIILKTEDMLRATTSKYDFSGFKLYFFENILRR